MCFYFLDKFVIVKPEERETYREYSDRCQNIEKIALQKKQMDKKIEEEKKLAQREKMAIELAKRKEFENKIYGKK